MLKVFVGYDPRESIGFHVFCDSLIRHSSRPLEIIPLSGQQRDGTNAFTYSRFLVPYLCGFKGTALFVDGSDMLIKADIAGLFALADPAYAVQVVKHEYQTKHPTKYIGTSMQCDNRDYSCKNWSSVILWNCEHTHNFITQATIDISTGKWLHSFQWIGRAHMGDLHSEWNHLVGEQEYNPDAKLIHYTLGIPAIPHYANCDYAEDWFAARDRMLTAPTAAVYRQ